MDDADLSGSVRQDGRNRNDPIGNSGVTSFDEARDARRKVGLIISATVSGFPDTFSRSYVEWKVTNGAEISFAVTFRLFFSDQQTSVT
jgi:hypothetical protein